MFVLFAGLGALMSSLLYSPSVHAAISKDQFVNILCKGKDKEAKCKKDGKKDNKVKVGNKTYKFADWKNEKPSDLRAAKAAKVTTPGELREYRDEQGGDDDLGNPIEGEGCGGVKTSIIKCAQTGDSETDVKQDGVWGLLLIVLNIMVAGVGVVAVGGIVYGAVLYTTAEDKADQVKKATEVITNVVIGLIAFAFMYSALNFLIPGGVFN